MYNYDFRKVTASGLASESIHAIHEKWIGEVAQMIAKALPKNLTTDGVQVSPVQRGFVQVKATGYNRSDLETSTTIALRVDFTGEVNGAIYYKDVMMSRETQQDIVLAQNDSPALLLSHINHFLSRFQAA